MKRVYFAPEDPEGSGPLKPPLAVFVEMAGGHAVASWNKKQLGSPAKRDELMRGFERALPDGRTLRVQAFPIAQPDSTAPIPAPQPQSEGFAPYRVRAWIDGEEAREIIAHAANEDRRLAMILLVFVGLSEIASGILLFPALGPTRLLFTGVIFLLGAFGVWKRWNWSVSMALVVAVADTLILLGRGALGAQSTASFALAIIARIMLASTLWRLQQNAKEKV